MSEVNLTGGVTGDFVLSNDGAFLYLAGNDGTLRVFNTATGAVVQAMLLGTTLGAIDISPDGSFLLITEQQPLSFTPGSNAWLSNVTQSVVYRFDIATSNVSALTYTSQGSDYVLADVAITSTGTAVFSENILPGWSGWTPLVTLDLATGGFTELTGQRYYYQGGSLTAAPDNGTVLYGQLNLSSAEAYILSPTGSILANNGIYTNDVYGYAGGVEAYSGSGASGRVAIYTGGSVHLWNGSFGYIANLTAAIPELSGVTGLRFSGDGQSLYALAADSDRIYEVRLSDQTIVKTIALDDHSYGVSAWGDELVLSPDEQTLFVRTTEGIVAVSNVDSNVYGTAGDDIFFGQSGSDLYSGLAGRDVINGDDGRDTLNGGAGDDIITGGLGLDRLTGGLGADLFQDTIAGLSGDTITDFTRGDRIVLTDATLSTSDAWWLDASRTVLTFTGGSITFASPLFGRLAVDELPTGGIELRLAGGDADNDFNGDGRSDILWRSDSGNVTNWLARTNGGFAGNLVNANLALTTDWQVAGTGDFNGDGRDDVLWRHNNGTVTDWLGQANGGFAGNFDNANLALTNDWQVAGVGDFNGDGRDDVLWRASNGTVTNWLGQASGGFEGNFANANLALTTEWQVAGVGDFNGDGRDDVLWRHTNGTITNWLGQGSGGFTGNFANANLALTNEWKVAGVGDFNGDGYDDILWRHTNGTVTNWLGDANGGFTGNFANANVALTNAWTIVDVGDYNGDGRDDVLWRNADGSVTDWLGQANGGFAGNFANANLPQGTDWHVSPSSYLI